MIPESTLRAALEVVTGEPAVMVGDLRYDLVHPCGDCPFLKRSPFHGGVAASLPGYFESIEAGHFAHSCHKTDPRQACDGPHESEGPVQHCAGALVMLLRDRKRWMQSPLVQAIDEGRFDPLAFQAATKRDRRRVFTVRGMMRFYLGELAKHGEIGE